MQRYMFLNDAYGFTLIMRSMVELCHLHSDATSVVLQ